MTIAQPHISQMSAYQLADFTPPSGKRLISLCQNEGLRPPSPFALEAAKKAAATSMLYPDPDWTGLREVIAEVHALSADNILCGNGSLDLIGALARVFSGPERAATLGRVGFGQADQKPGHGQNREHRERNEDRPPAEGRCKTPSDEGREDGRQGENEDDKA